MCYRLPIPILLLLCTSFATAQTSLTRHEAIVNAALRSQAPAAYKTTATKQRVIAESNHVLTGPNAGVQDSIHYLYSGDRGSTFSIWDYSRAGFMYYHYDYTPNSIFSPFGPPPEPHVRCDSLFFYRKDQAGLNLVSQKNRTYNRNGSVQEGEAFFFFNGQKPSLGDYRDVNTYNAQGQLSVSTHVTYVPQWGWSDTTRKYYFYDATGRSTGDSSFYFSPAVSTGERNFMTYNASGQLTGVLTKLLMSGAWQDTWRYEFSYYPSGKLKSVVSMEYINGNPAVYAVDSLIYMPGIDPYTERHSRYNQDTRRITRHFNTRQLPDTIKAESFDPDSGTWITDETKIFLYNNMNNPVECRQYIFTQPNAAILHRYYYEEYEPQDVKTVPTADLKVYPNPVNGTLHIEWQHAPQNVPTGIRIVGMTGQVVYSEQIRWNGQQVQINTNAWASGIYALVLTGAEGATLHTQLLVNE